MTGEKGLEQDVKVQKNENSKVSNTADRCTDRKRDLCICVIQLSALINC